MVTRPEHTHAVAPMEVLSREAGAKPEYTLSATEIFRRDKEARRRRCHSASQRSADDESAEKIGAAAEVDHE